MKLSLETAAVRSDKRGYQIGPQESLGIKICCSGGSTDGCSDGDQRRVLHMA
jgi:hypothetical protein